MPQTTAVEITSEVRCDEVFVRAKGDSFLSVVRLEVGGHVRRGLGRARWQGTPKRGDGGDLVAHVISGDFEKTVPIEHVSPIEFRVGVPERVRAYEPFARQPIAGDTCGEPAGEISVAIADPFQAHTWPWPYDRPVQVEAYGESLQQDLTVSWNGWVVDRRSFELLLDAPRFDIDGDGVTVAQGDCDDHDDAVHPGAVDTSGDSIDQDCDGSAKGRAALKPRAEPSTPGVGGDAPWSAFVIDNATGFTGTVTLHAYEERWLAIRTPNEAYPGSLRLPLTISSDAPVWVEVWDGGAGPDAPIGALATKAPTYSVRVSPGNLLLPRGPHHWEAIPVQHEPLPSRGTSFRALGGALMDLAVGAGRAVYDAAASIFADRRAVYAEPSIPGGHLLYLRLVPADDLSTVRTAKVKFTKWEGQ